MLSIIYGMLAGQAAKEHLLDNHSLTVVAQNQCFRAARDGTL